MPSLPLKKRPITPYHPYAKMVWSLEKKKDDIIPLVVSARVDSTCTSQEPWKKKKGEKERKKPKAWGDLFINISEKTQVMLQVPVKAAM